MFSRKLFYALAAMGIAAMPCFASAEETIDPKQIRIITKTEATSNCIGDPKTPTCAMDTFLACIIRRDISLCKKVGVITPCFGPPNAYARYVVEKIKKLSPEDMEFSTYLLKGSKSEDSFYDLFYKGEICQKSDNKCGTFNIDSYETLKFDGKIWTFAKFPYDANRCVPDPD